ncbi:MAG: NAD(P)-dependent oxidoreductase [Marvinbryantia sp.]|jgi:phosphoglycerate dehydrogenase-like enzyme
MRLLVTGAISWNEKQIKELEDLGHEVFYVQDERIPLESQEIDASQIEGVICNGLFLYNEITAFHSLRYIQLTSAGYDRVPMDYIKRHQIEIHNAGSVYSIPMAEFALAGVLQLYKQSSFFYENQKQHRWEKHRGLLELSGKSVCIIGCGNVGTECAKRFRAFGCHVTGINRHVRNDKNYEKILRLEQLESTLMRSDIVVLSVPLTDETKYLMGKEKLACIKQGAVLVNISRGALVDTDALIKNLPRLGGVVLDVFEEEPLSEDSPLWEMENVILTPHNSFVGEGNKARIQKLILKNIEER